MKKLELNIPLSSDLWADFELSQSSSPYYSSGITNFALLVAGAKDGVLSIRKADMRTCREEVIDYHIRKRLGGKSASQFEDGLSDWFNKSRVVVLKDKGKNWSQAKDERARELSTKLLNIIEKEYKWPLTKVYSLHNDLLGSTPTFSYFEGPGKWVRSPQMMSLYLLFIRAGESLLSTPRQQQINKMRSISGIFNLFKNANDTADLNRIRQLNTSLPIIFKHYNQLFGGRTIKDLYSPAKRRYPGGAYLLNEGVQKMISLNTSDQLLWDAWSKIRRFYDGKRIM
jgi:hypothetical protein